MGLLRRSSQKDKEESVFGRLGKTQISYSLEAEHHQQEQDASTTLVDNLPLLNLECYVPLRTQKAKKKDLQGFLKSPLAGKHPRSSGKKKTKIRGLFSKGNSALNQNIFLRRFGEIGYIPKISHRRDTEDQSDSEGKAIIEPSLLATSEPSVYTLHESSPPLSLFGEFKFDSEEGDAIFSDSFEKLFSSVEQADLIQSETTPVKDSDNKIENKCTVNVLDELIELESSRCKKLKNEDEGSNIDDTYHSLVSNVVSQLMRKRANSNNNIHDEDSLGNLSSPQHQHLNQNTIISSFNDEEATVVTVKISNCSKPSSTKALCPSAKKRDIRSTVPSNNFSLAEQKKKFDQVVKIYGDTLKMRVSEFGDLQAYHSAMITSATKMAKLMIATNQNDSAQKYMNIAKTHRLKICNSSTSGKTSSSSYSSSDESSASSSSYSSSSSVGSGVSTSIRSRISF